MTNNEVLNLYYGLLGIKDHLVPLPATVSYTIIKNLKTIEPIAQSIETARQMILDKYAVPSIDDPGYYNIKPGCEDIVSKEFAELQDVENDVTLQKIPFSKISELQLTVIEIEALYPMIDGEG